MMLNPPNRTGTSIIPPEKWDVSHQLSRSTGRRPPHLELNQSKRSIRRTIQKLYQELQLKVLQPSLHQVETIVRTTPREPGFSATEPRHIDLSGERKVVTRLCIGPSALPDFVLFLYCVCS